MVFKIMSGNHFSINDLGDLDLRRDEPKINRELALTKSNHNMKFEVSTLHGF